jgi:hypothetical protein
VGAASLVVGEARTGYIVGPILRGTELVGDFGARCIACAGIGEKRHGLVIAQWGGAQPRETQFQTPSPDVVMGILTFMLSCRCRALQSWYG